jgi:hypothetical protein
LQLFPLLLVVAAKSARVGPLAGCLDLKEADQGVSEGDGVVRPGLERGQRGFADGRDRVRGKPTEVGEVGDQPFQRGPQLIFRFPGSRYVAEFRLGFAAEA